MPYALPNPVKVPMNIAIILQSFLPWMNPKRKTNCFTNVYQLSATDQLQFTLYHNHHHHNLHHHHQPSSASPSSITIIFILPSCLYLYLLVDPIFPLPVMTTELNPWLPPLCLLYPRSFHSSPVAYCYLFPRSIFCICPTLPSFKYSLPQSSLKRERKEVCCLASETLQYYLMAGQYSVLLLLIIWLMNALWLEFNFPTVFTMINGCTIAAREVLL